MMKYLALLIGLVCVAGASSCTPKRKAVSGSEVLSMNVSGKQVKSELRDSASLLKFLKDNQYYSVASAAAGTKVFYSTSYGTDQKSGASAEAGQAYGELRQSNGGLFYYQGDNTTTQALVPPGSSNQTGPGISRWKFDGQDGFAQLMLDVATGQRGRVKRPIHNGYSQIEVAIVSFSGGTAGGQVSYNDAVEVSLSGGESKTEIYFAKGLGPVAMEFRETYMPGGTAKVYLQPAGSAVASQSH